MIRIRIIDEMHEADVRLPNEPFPLFAKIVPTYIDGRWDCTVEPFPAAGITEMCFPDENYDCSAMPDSLFIGAYDDARCVGLAVLQPGFFKYMYLYDLKVNRDYRRRHIGQMLIEKAKEIAAARGYRGLYTQGQDNNAAACLFYLHTGFYIGGLDTNVYKGTPQEGKADILFYTDC